MIDQILTAFWIFLPAGIANMTPPLANKVPWLKQWETPLDFGKKIWGQRILGDNKTWRGVISGVLMAGVVAAIQYSVVGSSYISLNTLTISIILGMILGFGALLGDALESFFKRWAGVKAGHSWFPFDQTDYIIGGLVLFYPFVHLPLRLVVMIFIIYFGLHLVVSYIGYLLGFKDGPI